ASCGESSAAHSAICFSVLTTEQRQWFCRDKGSVASTDCRPGRTHPQKIGFNNKDSLPNATKRKVEKMLKAQEAALLHVFLTDLMVIQEGYRDGWSDLDESIEIMINTYESILPKGYMRKPKVAEVIYFPTHKRGQK